MTDGGGRMKRGGGWAGVGREWVPAFAGTRGDADGHARRVYGLLDSGSEAGMTDGWGEG